MRKGYWRHYDMWNEEDGFFYSFLRHPDGSVHEMKVRSLVGIIPFFACDVWDDAELQQFPEFYAAFRWLLKVRPNLVNTCVQSIPHTSGHKYFFGLLNGHELEKFLKNIWDPNEFRSDYGLRSVSKYHEKHPARLEHFVLGYDVRYETYIRKVPLNEDYFQCLKAKCV